MFCPSATPREPPIVASPVSLALSPALIARWMSVTALLLGRIR